MTNSNPKRDYPEKLTGSSSWVQRPPAFESGETWQVERYFSDEINGIRTSDDQLSIDISYGETKYVVTLNQKNGRYFEGTMSAHAGPDIWNGRVNARLLETDTGYLLFGQWIENNESGIADTWWVELHRQ